MTGSGRVRVQLEATPGSAREARAVLRGLFESSAARPDVVATALLMVSELVMDAASRGHGGLTLDAEVGPSSVRVAVTEPEPRLLDPEPGNRAESQEDTATAAGALDVVGVGLLLVDGLATRWGVDNTGDEVAVWFELSFRHAR